jgi:murein DD-endopeptidase MepM/ murein hydrolase activator NlpD
MTILFPGSVYTKDAGRFGLGTVEGYPVSGDISSLFGATDIEEHSEGHNGTDIAAPEGQYIYAPCAMTITDLFSLDVVSTNPMFQQIKDWFGNSVWGAFTDDEGLMWRTMFAHLSEPPDTLSEGDDIAKGAFIGYVGSTGMSTGPHLHWTLGPAENRWLGRDNGNVEALDYCTITADVVEPPKEDLSGELLSVNDSLDNARASSYAIISALQEARAAIDRALTLVG